MIQAKVSPTEKRKFILGNVAETWIQASGKKKEASMGIFLLCGAEHSRACSRSERLKTILMLRSLKRSHYREYPQTPSKVTEFELRESNCVLMSVLWQIVLF